MLRRADWGGQCNTVIQRSIESGMSVVIVGSPISLKPCSNIFFVLNDVQENGKLAADRMRDILGGEGSLVDNAHDRVTHQVASIETVRTTPLEDKAITIRGVATLTAPLFVQDSSGSIAVHLNRAVDLNLGDEVEMIGKRTDVGFTPQFIATDVRLLWDRTLVVPISITSTEAASGVFEASLVELRGKLRAKSMDRNP